jgi:dihydroxynaphthoic acid synthetase
MQYEDILFEVADDAAIITINRPQRMNAFRARTIEELIHAFKRAWAARDVAAVILTATGERAFCVGGDQKVFNETGSYGTSENGLWEIDALHTVIRDIPKPVIAAVNGHAIGGGHVIHVLCDVTIAADHAKFGQAGPRVASFDAGWGAAYLARIVGEKRAREIWFFCRQYTAQQALDWGLVNKVVPGAELMTEAKAWVKEVAALSPTALRALKYGFNADSAHIFANVKMAGVALEMLGNTAESNEGKQAFVDKRPPNFKQFR